MELYRCCPPGRIGVLGEAFEWAGRWRETREKGVGLKGWACECDVEGREDLRIKEMGIPGFGICKEVGVLGFGIGG